MCGGILAETLADLRALHGAALEDLRVEEAVVGVVFSAIKLSDGRGGMAGTPRLDARQPPPEPGRPPPGALVGSRVLSLLEPWPEDPYRRALAVAALSALSAPFLDERRYRVVYDRDALELVDVKPGMTVTIVGAFHSYIDRLKAVPGLRLHVLELREAALRESDLPFYVPAERAQEVVPRSDALLITGLSLANGTLEGLLSLSRSEASVAVVGPSGSILPEALFRRNVRLVGGCVLTDCDAALKLLSQGASARHLYGVCARKINLSPR